VGDDARLMARPDIVLEQIHRNAGPISYFAEHLRLDKPVGAWRAPLLKEKEVWIVNDRENIGDRSLLAADQIICAYNKTRIGLNRHVRTLLDRKADTPQNGDKVICLQNSREHGVFNGQQGRIVDIDRPGGRLTFKPTYGDYAIELPYDPLAFNATAKKGQKEKRNPGDPIPFDYAYCVTAHKSQGDEWSDVLVFEERCELWEHKRWAYTAASRAKKRLVWVVDRGR
jgi:exodeoxyribonuclease-5